jgi:hypothetical protein
MGDQTRETSAGGPVRSFRRPVPRPLEADTVVGLTRYRPLERSAQRIIEVHLCERVLDVET